MSERTVHTSAPGLNPLEVSFTFQPKNGHRAERQPRHEEHAKDQPTAPGTIPRVSRLMALAVRFEGLIQRGDVQNYADLAQLGHVSRQRITQLMMLLNLAPDLQEVILFLPRTTEGRDPIREREAFEIARVALWSRQRKMWAELLHGHVAE